MTAVARDERRRAFRIASDAWRDPGFAWEYDHLVQVAMESAGSDSPTALIPAAVGRLLPEGRVRSWAIISIDDVGGLHRDRGASADPGLYARAVAWLWTATSDSRAADDAAAHVEAWSTDGRAEAVACMPLLRDGTVKSLVAVWLIADDMDTIVNDVSRLTLIGRLWTGTHGWARSVGAGGESGGDGTADGLTVRQTVILQAMADGLTNAQIARLINFSESTVRVESMGIYRYFGVHSRTDAVRAAQEAGVL